MPCYDTLTEDETELFSSLCQDDFLDYEAMKRLEPRIKEIIQSLVDKGKITHIHTNVYDVVPGELRKWVEWADENGV